MDITRNVLLAAEAKDSWSRGQASMVAWVLSLTAHAEYDWDSDAGESWISFFIGGRTVAIVGVDVPLVLYDRSIERWPEPLVKVAVEELDRVGLSCAPEALLAAFGYVPTGEDFCWESFSASQLWYATI